MKQCYVPKAFRADSLARIAQANEIIARYQDMGLRLTLRQLYYQHVAANLIPNTEKSYKNLASLVSDGRLAGLIDWDAIEDRGRVPETPGEWDSVEQIVRSAIRQYRCPRWQGQTHYVELWVEKQALAGVLAPLADEFHVTLMVNKGYSSQSAMHEAAGRFIEHGDRDGVLLYIGDHDPSGEDMVRDIASRMETFGAAADVRKVALTRAQIDEHEPPPQPAKTTDSRFSRYEAEHGNESWEVDSLPPDVLERLVREAMDDVLDRDAMDALIAKEDADRELVRAAVARALNPKPGPGKSGRTRR